MANALPPPASTAQSASGVRHADLFCLGGRHIDSTVVARPWRHAPPARRWQYGGQSGVPATFGEGFTHRALSKEEVLSEPFLLDNSLRMVGFLSPSGPEISMDLLSSIEEAFRSSGTQMLGEAIDRLTPLHHEQQILVALIALIHRGRLKANLREGLTEKTNLRWENRGNATIAS
jgi:hypothetical protein